ncbi:MAG: UspA protein [Ramlibacter sp.]|nr:UspA protein [Ramlibacter sp.]
MLKILIPVDGSELSLDAVRHALGLLRQGLQASFVLANVQEPPSLYEMLVTRDPQILEVVSAGAAAHLLEGAQSLCDAAGANYESEIASGDPAHTLIDIVERYGCDAVIIGARGKGGLTGSLLGSVSQVLAHACPVPVTVVKHSQPDEAMAEAATRGLPVSTRHH